MRSLWNADILVTDDTKSNKQFPQYGLIFVLKTIHDTSTHCFVLMGNEL